MPRSMLARVGRLTPIEWRDLVRAQAALIVSQVIVWTRPRGSLVSMPGPACAAPMESGDRARQLGVAVHRVASYGPFRPNCLVRSVALMRMLERGGIHGARLCIGVRPARGKLLAHAWVEYGQRVLGDRPAHVRNFEVLGQVEVVPRGGTR